MNTKYLIMIANFLFLLSSCGVYSDVTESMALNLRNWVALDMAGNETDSMEDTVMWKLKEEGIWVSSLRDKISYSKKRYHYWGYAYKFCDDSILYGFNDWKLPSIEELSYLREKHIIDLSHKRGIEDISSYFVWSSSKGKDSNHRATMAMTLGHIHDEEENGSQGLFFCIRTEK